MTSLLFNTLSRLVIHRFLSQEQVFLQSMAAVTVCSDFGAFPPSKICHCFYFFALYLSWSGGIGCYDHIFFFNVEFRARFFTLLFHSHQQSHSSSLSAIKTVSSAYLRLLIFLPAILIPACDLSSLAFHMLCSVCKLNMQGDNIQPWCTTFPNWKQSIVHPQLMSMLLLDIHTGFSGDRWGDLALPSLRIFHSLLGSTQSKALA